MAWLVRLCTVCVLSTQLPVRHPDPRGGNLSPAALRAASTATRGFFLVAGSSTSSWAPLVPLAKARLGLDEAGLGLVLLCMGLGSAGATLVAGFLSHRYGNRNIMTLGGLGSSLALVLVTLAPSAVLLGAALVFFGASAGVLDVAMNAHAVDVEKLHGRPVMSGFHGLFSLGGLAGSAGMSALLGTGAPPVMCAGVVSLLLATIVATQRPKLLAHVRDQTATRRSMWVLPSATVVLLGLLCLVVFLAEGAMLDWSAVFLRSVRGFAISSAGLGFAAFSIAMASGRLLGDRITSALGPVRVVRYGSLVAAAGFALATLLPWPATSLVGFVLVGVGASNIVPVLFSAAGRTPGVSPGISIATVTTLGYAGMLTGPAAIGFIAHATSLSLALGGIAVLLVMVSACATIARP
jgi:predicted MFS family arabinose efflux permease